MAIAVKENEPLARYTIYKIGGHARYFVEARIAAEAEEAARFAVKNNVRFFVLGAGSNTLVSDQGFDGLVIHMAGGSVRTEGERLIVDAGVMMARAVMEAAAAGLARFEWGIGVPGTVGGSVRGNAGCFGGEMKDAVESVDVFDASSAARRHLAADECAFGYRHSSFKRHPEWVILSATLKLRKGNPAVIQNEVRRITMERSAKQDIGTKSCGCIFKNPAWPENSGEREKLLRERPELVRFADRSNIPASFLIDRAGLKGERSGNIVVSEKHANFFINEGGGTAGEVMSLIAVAKHAVQEKYGITLREEIHHLGFEK